MYLHGTALIKQRIFTYLRLCRGVAFACHDHLVVFGTNVRHPNTYSLSKELLIYRQILCNILEITVVLITSFFYTVYEDARKIWRVIDWTVVLMVAWKARALMISFAILFYPYSVLYSKNKWWRLLWFRIRYTPSHRFSSMYLSKILKVTKKGMFSLH